jgi:hypothetical protein
MLQKLAYFCNYNIAKTGVKKRATLAALVIQLMDKMVQPRMDEEQARLVRLD